MAVFTDALETIVNRETANDVYIAYSRSIRSDEEKMGMYIDAIWDAAFEAGQTEGYKEARSDGFQLDDDGAYDDGFSDGRESGMEDGWSEGYEEGERQGYEKGYEEGLHEGKGDGISEGFANAERLLNSKIAELNARIEELQNQK